MNNTEYQRVQDSLVMLAQMMKSLDLDLDEFLARISDADSIGPMIDPTLWMRGNKKLENVRRLAVTAKTFQDEINRQIHEERKAKERG